MNKSIYLGLAYTGIRKNRRIYVPYIITCTGMIMMYFIVKFLSISPLLLVMKGGRSTASLLVIGKFIIAIFSVIFLLYSSSFLVKNRYREFGLYNVLGIDKRGIYKILAWESLISSSVSLLFGLISGTAFSKLAELALIKIVSGETDFTFRFSLESVLSTVGIYIAVFFVIFLRSLILVRKSKPIELLNAAKTGEKPPKANYVLAISGVVILGIAYYIAISIKNPMAAIIAFFAAVVLVIIATYLLFISGSVVLCRLLQKNKDYYYKKNHFVSVSSMKHRMKRNGAGLASICILSTMVLVTFSSTSSLYIGMDDSLDFNYPLDSFITVRSLPADSLSEENITAVKQKFGDILDSLDLKPDTVSSYGFAVSYGILKNGRVLFDPSSASLSDYASYDDLRTFIFITEEQYASYTGKSVSLSDGEALIAVSDFKYGKDTLTFDSFSLKTVGKAEGTADIIKANSDNFPTVLLVIKDFSVLDAIEQPGDKNLLSYCIYYGYNLDADEETVSDSLNEIRSAAISLDELKNVRDGYEYLSGCKYDDKHDFISAYGGLFFLGIIFSVIFIFAAAMIIYYKQVSEGYEDRDRFAIMQKIGMTGSDIKKSVNSQILTVFSAPLLLSGFHLAFAFPLVIKVLKLFGFDNLPLTVSVNIGAFVLFGIFYAIIYKITARVYFSIVSSAEK